MSQNGHLRRELRAPVITHYIFAIGISDFSPLSVGVWPLRFAINHLEDDQRGRKVICKVNAHLGIVYQ